MKIFRALSKEEYDCLLNSNSLYYKHKTCLCSDWLLFQHSEDYDTGKYFFFTLEDTVNFTNHTDTYDSNSIIIEINIDKETAYKYLAYGKYCYGDYNTSNNWTYNLMHCIPEVFLPYSFVEEKIKSNNFTLIQPQDRKNIKSASNKNRLPEIITLGNLLAQIKGSQNYKEYCKQNSMKYTESIYYKTNFLEESRKLDKLLLQLPKCFDDFVRVMESNTSEIEENSM